LRHNLIRQRIAEQLTQFVRAHHLGVVVEAMDFRLGTNYLAGSSFSLSLTALFDDIFRQ
jgi:hypothetical protein